MDELERRVGGMDLIDSGGEEDEEEVVTAEDAIAVSPPLLCVLCDETLASPALLWAHCREAHGLDFEAERQRMGLSFYQTIALVNHLRMCKRDGEAWEGTLEADAPWTRDEAFLRPVLEGDPVLCCLQDEDDGAWSDDDDDNGGGGGGHGETEERRAAAEEEKEDGARAARRLARENAELRARLADMQGAMAAMSGTLARIAGDGPVAASSAAPAAAPPKTVVKPDNDSYYFSSYSARQIHETMLRDRVRTEAYRDAFYLNPGAVRGKTVLDIGCGTGILSMFAAKAGAARVIGIDGADILDKARLIVADNGLADRVTLVKSKTEEARLPGGVEQVDCIVSEWMGYFLLFESMLPTVLYARDKWLRPGGRMYPDEAVMFVAGIDAVALRERSVGFWRDVYGFDMSALVEERERVRSGAVVDVVPAEAVMTTEAVLRRFDLLTVRDDELDFESDFSVEASRDADLEAFCVYFDTSFRGGLERPVTLPTGPQHTPTHWVQTSFYLAAPVPLRAGDRVDARMVARRRADNPREYDVGVSYAVNGGERRTQDFSILANE